MDEHAQPRRLRPGGAVDVAELVDRAFHFRGDVTVRTTGGREITGYLFNRDTGRRRNGAETPAFAQMFETATGREIMVRYEEIEDVLFTGRSRGRP